MRFLLQAGLCVLLLQHFCSCAPASGDEQTLVGPAELNEKTRKFLVQYVQDRVQPVSLIPKPVTIAKQASIEEIYQDRDFAPLWSDSGKWYNHTIAVYASIAQSRWLGLFPEDYHFTELEKLWNQHQADSLGKSIRRDPQFWFVCDLLFTDAFVTLLHDVKFGRLPNDSVSLNKDSSFTYVFIRGLLEQLESGVPAAELLAGLEPRHPAYQQLKAGLRNFMDSADFRDYTVVPLPGKDKIRFQNALQKRLFEGGFLSSDSISADSATLVKAIKEFQQSNGLQADGRAGDATVRMLNLHSKEKFVRVAISLDKYKKLPAEMPEKYIWVNTASNMLEVIENGKLVMNSRVISGKPKTKTPALTSAVSMLITYPQWVPPASIIEKEILPAVKKNPAYLARKGFSLLDKEGNEVDPHTVDWSIYSRGIPYRVVQGSGDANALGVLKFHFDNKYAVYLHDTNQRYLFAIAMRSLSHGCIRVQEWEKLAQYILRNESGAGRQRLQDSVRIWLKNKEKRHLALKNKLPVFLRYVTATSNGNGIIFHDDVYGDDRKLREKYFAGR